MTYTYEKYETNWWRRFTAEELETEKQIRAEKGYGFFETFETDEDLGDPVHLRNDEVKEIFKRDKSRHPEKYMPSNAEYFSK